MTEQDTSLNTSTYLNNQSVELNFGATIEDGESNLHPSAKKKSKKKKKKGTKAPGEATMPGEEHNEPMPVIEQLPLVNEQMP